MMNKLMPLLLGSIALSTHVYAEDDFLVMDDDVDTIRVQKKSDIPDFRMPSRTSFFSGFEYYEGVSETRTRNENIKFVVADGSTRLNPNFRLRYALSQVESTTGALQQKSARQTNMTIAPRYEQFVNNNFSFFAEPVYMHQSEPDGTATTEIKLRPGGQFTYRRHFLTTIYTHSFKEIKKYQGMDDNEFNTFEVGANYTYRASSNINYGLSYTQAGNVDDAPTKRRRAFTIKPSIRFKHWQGIISEINVPYNFNESGIKWAGEETWKINFNNNYAINKYMKLVANIGYEFIEFHAEGRYLDESKEGISAKLGFNFSF